MLIPVFIIGILVIWNPFKKPEEIVEPQEPQQNEEIVELEDTMVYLSPADTDAMPAGSIIDDDAIRPTEITDFFYSSEISDAVKDRIWNISYKENDNISLNELRYLRVLHWGFDGETHIGELIVNQSIANDILEILRDLYLNDFLIERMVLIDEYSGDDESSMRDNNTSAFNYRVISGTSTLSKHSLGMAIDINPLYNPYVVKKSDGTVSISPAGSEPYVDRDSDYPYMLTNDNLCVKLFKEKGFTWGGDWKTVKDYQHFEK